MTADRSVDFSNFGDLLRQHRLAAALTQEELAERAGMSRRGISDLERGARTRPYRETLKLLVAALGLEGEARRMFLAAARERAPAAGDAEPCGFAPLPSPPNALIGRADDMATAVELLNDPRVRLLTLTGAGGSGKTRLAIETADQQATHFSDGVAFVDLAPLNNPDLVLGAIAAAVHVCERPDRSLGQTLAQSLALRHVLLVLDNFEHLLPAANEIGNLVAAAPNLKILVTSRVRLGLAGEQELSVPPLAVPRSDRELSPDVVRDVAAVRLFVARARGFDPRFELSWENSSAVAAICRRLDGLPLAIELAAARIKLLPPPALLMRLERSLPLLTGGARNAPERHRTLRNTIAWSYDLLSDEERIFFRRLAAFAGGWTFDSAEAVVDPASELNILEAMGSLVDNSLVRRLDQPDGEPRFTMLETVREFASEELARFTGELETVRQAHAAHFASLARGAAAGVNIGQSSEMALLRREQDNLRAMLDFLLHRGEAETVLRVAGEVLSDYWFAVGGHFREGREWLERALLAGADASVAARAWGHYGVTHLAVFQGDLAAAERAGAACYALARQAGDPRLAIRGCQTKFMAEEANGRAAAAAPFAREAVAAAREFGDPTELGWSLLGLGNALWHLNDLSEASAALEEGILIFRSLGSDWGQAELLTNLGRIALTAGKLREAARRHGEALDARRRFGELVSVYDDLVGLAAVALASHRDEEAAWLLGAESGLIALSGFAGFAETPIMRRQLEQQVRDQLGEEGFRAAWQTGRTVTTAEAMAEAIAIAAKLAATTEAEGAGNCQSRHSPVSESM